MSAQPSIAKDKWVDCFSCLAPDPVLLASVLANRIGEVQLADADIAMRGKDLTEDLLRFRKLSGEVAFDIKGVTDILKKMGAYRSVGPEVFADAMDALDAVEAGRRAGSSLARWVAESTTAHLQEAVVSTSAPCVLPMRFGKLAEVASRPIPPSRRLQAIKACGPHHGAARRPCGT
jgi:hypothetical protein